MTMLYLLLASGALGLLIFYGRNRKFFSGVFFTALQGLCALCAVNAVGGFLGVSLAVSPFSVAVSSLGGTPGVVLLLLLRLLAA